MDFNIVRLIKPFSETSLQQTTTILPYMMFNLNKKRCFNHAATYIILDR